MNKVLSLQGMKAKEDVQLRAASSLSISCKKFSSLSVFIC
ncbi:class III lanthipeptide [Alkalihalobacillus pseudalcaliphilus]|nr:class III lanthipeptide [Alkalihalobacillus pseudalcaliphilus]